MRRQTLKNAGIFQPTTQDRVVLLGKTPSRVLQAPKRIKRVTSRTKKAIKSLEKKL
jgi:hypothetical protein